MAACTALRSAVPEAEDVELVETIEEADELGLDVVVTETIDEVGVDVDEDVVELVVDGFDDSATNAAPAIIMITTITIMAIILVFK